MKLLTDKQLAKLLGAYVLPPYVTFQLVGWELWAGRRAVFVFYKASEADPSPACVREAERLVAELEKAKLRIRSWGSRLTATVELRGAAVPPFTPEEVASLRNTVAEAVGRFHYVVTEAWNGPRAHSLSIAVEREG